MDNTEENASRTPSSRPPPPRHRRKVRVFFYGFCFLLALIIIPAILLPPWLATKGIEINAISGISLGKRIVINELAISINSYTITMKQLVLEHFVDDESAISDASWRLTSEHTKVRLAPTLRQLTHQQGVTMSDIDLYDVTFNLTDLSPPYVFSANARLASMYLKGKSAQPIQQKVHDLNLVLTTEPFITLTGDFNAAHITALHPADVHTHQYPIDINKTHFSISWQPYTTPLSVHIDSLNPQWPSTTHGFQQHGENITFSTDLSQLTTTIKLTADALALDRPANLPEFIEKPDDEHDGIHLGRAIASLAQLPLQKVKIKQFSYGELIIRSRLVLETPRVRMNRPNKKAKLHLKGQALGPDPYNINVLVKHTGNLDARFSGTISGPKGNSLDCQADVNFSSPLPKKLNCSANFKHTQDFTNKLKLFDMPHAALNKPIELIATQTSLQLAPPRKKTQTADTDTIAPQSSYYQYQDVLRTHYRIQIVLPESINVNLNKYAFQHPALNTATQLERRVSSVALRTDGTLNLNAIYENDQVRLSLDEKTTSTNKPEVLSFSNQEIDSQFTTKISTFNCQIPFSLKGKKQAPKTNAPPQGKLQCHSKLHIKSAIGTLSPSPDIVLSKITAQSAIAIHWTTDTLDAELNQSRINVETLQMYLGGTWVETKADKLQLIAERINVTQQFASNTTKNLTVKIQDKPLSLTANISAQQLITNSETKSTRRHPKSKKNALQNKNQLPVQKYQSKVTATFSNSTLSSLFSNKQALQTVSSFQLSSDYHIGVNITQNAQPLPSMFASGAITYLNDNILIDGITTNNKKVRLLPFKVRYNTKSQDADITLHRNDIVFTAKKTLKKYFLPHLPTTYDLNSGTVSFDAKFARRNNLWTGKVGVFTDGLSGYVNNIHFADVNIALTSQITPLGIRSIHPISIHAGYLHAGVLLENLFAILEFDTQTSRYRLRRANAYSLGGSISVHDVQSNSLRHIPTTPIIIHGLDLTKLIESIDLKDIEATGTLDGTLPLAFNDGLPVVTNGTLHARYPGGVLKYKEGSKIDQNIEAAGENSLAMISRILKNYNYHSLSVDLDYSKEGQLNMSSRFKGHNPDFLKGQPINLNLNIEDDIPALLKTLSVINSSKLESMFLKQLGIDE
ncbi:YdbH domain-containing protein [Photobacterium makurazakiensis]|uniref:intermembrane phospholipid transport protein YdbH family protein n=1 Tax=Photobacterium makurazakiensis TaxID=2910234 RepID=UPI003D14C345